MRLRMSTSVKFYESPPVDELTVESEGYIFVYCQRGRIQNNFGTHPSLLTHGDVFLLPKGKNCSLSVSVVETYFYVVNFDGELLSGEREELSRLNSFLEGIKEGDAVASIISLPPEEIVFFESVLSKIKNQGPDSSATTLFSVLSLFSAISDILSKENLKNLAEKYSKEDMIKYCILYVDAHPTENISLSDMTKLSTISRAQFCKLFKAESGLSFNDYLNRKRIQRALALIKNGEKITDVAYNCGYSEFTTFYRNFIKFTGRNPTVYRNFVLNSK